MTFDTDEPFPQATVLVVDDYKDIVDLLILLLTSHGMNVLQAYSRAECLEIVRTHPGDLILPDVWRCVRH
jgi:CheY-like chemotaxis protein